MPLDPMHHEEFDRAGGHPRAGGQGDDIDRQFPQHPSDPYGPRRIHDHQGAVPRDRCASALTEVALARSVSPLYSAVMELSPGARPGTVSVAIPKRPSGAEPSSVLPAKNVIVPVGVTPTDDVAVAVKVTGSP